MALNNREFMEEIAKVRALGDRSPEERHCWEDGLVEQFIEHVRETGGTHSLMAGLLLEMLGDDVARWYA